MLTYLVLTYPMPTYISHAHIHIPCPHTYPMPTYISHAHIHIPCPHTYPMPTYISHAHIHILFPGPIYPVPQSHPNISCSCSLPFLLSVLSSIIYHCHQFVCHRVFF